MKHRHLQSLLSRKRAFSLVEVVLAIGVASFALLTIVALLPVGLKSAGESVDESQAVNLLTAIIADRRATPLSKDSLIYGLPAFNASITAPITNTFGVSEDTRPTGSDFSSARYRVRCIITPPASGRGDPYLMWIRVTWPALSTSASAAAVETVTAFAQP